MAPSPIPLDELLSQSRWLRRLAESLARCEAEAEDLVQETWLAALRHPPEGGRPARPWLARIARNLAANLRRGQARRAAHESAAPSPEPLIDPSAVAEEVELQRILAEALLRLEEPLRSTVVLRHIRGLDSRAIGALQKVPAGTVRWRLKRGLELLRADLDESSGGRRQWLAAFAPFIAGAPKPGGVPPTLGPSVSLSAGGLKSVALAVAAVVLIATTPWLVGSAERAPRSRADLGSLPLAAGPSTAELVPASAPPPLHDTSARQGARVSATTPLDTPARARFLPGRAPVRGKLRIAGTEAPLDEVLSIRLRTGDLSASETVLSAADGSFHTRTGFPRGFLLAEVLRPAGDPAVEHEAYFDPRKDEEWIVPVPWPNFVRGRVLDRGGWPLDDVELLVRQPKSEVGGVTSYPKKDGSFFLEDLVIGRGSFSLRRGFEQTEFPLAIERGPNELGDLFVSFGELVGDLSGRLRSEQGEPRGILILTDVSRGGSLAVGARGEFLFEDVPLGEYRLSVLSDDGRHYSSSSRLVSPPMADVEFVASGDAESLRFEAHDGVSAVDAMSLVRVLDQWWGELDCARRDVESWLLLAEGFCPASGKTPGSDVIRVQLSPGWGQAVLFSEAGGNPAFPFYRSDYGGRPLAGGEVLADGRFVAKSDEHGLALVSLASEPETLEFRLGGWRVLDVSDFGVVKIVALTPE